jgi:hypothetical protein
MIPHRRRWGPSLVAVSPGGKTWTVTFAPRVKPAAVAQAAAELASQGYAVRPGPAAAPSPGRWTMTSAPEEPTHA